MKASELVEQILLLISQHGDLEIRTEYDCMADSIDRVELSQWPIEHPHYVPPLTDNTPISERQEGFLII